MDEYRAAAIGLGLVQGIKGFQDTRRATALQKEDLGRKRKLFDLDLKSKELDLQKKEAEGSIDSLTADVLRQKLNLQKKAVTSTIDAQESDLSTQQVNLANQQQQLTGILQDHIASVQDNNPDSTASAVDSLPLGGSLKLGNTGLTLKVGSDNNQEKTAPWEKVAGTIDSYDTNEYTQKDAETLASKELGIGWQSKYPKVKSLINQKWGNQQPAGTQNDRAIQFNVGEQRIVPGKGTFKYIGNQKWQRVNK